MKIHLASKPVVAADLVHNTGAEAHYARPMSLAREVIARVLELLMVGHKGALASTSLCHPSRPLEKLETCLRLDEAHNLGKHCEQANTVNRQTQRMRLQMKGTGAWYLWLIMGDLGRPAQLNMI